MFNQTAKALILAYHRVVKIKPDPYALAIAPEYFAEQLEVLKKKYQLISLAELTQRLKQKNLPRRCLAITFDDGYADNFHNAKILLQRYQVPATIFLTAGGKKNQKSLWWDELTEVFLDQRSLPGNLELTLGAKKHNWQLDKIAVDKLPCLIHDLLRSLPEVKRNQA